MQLQRRQHLAVPFALVGMFFCQVGLVDGQSRPALPAAKAGAFYTGHYRNLFKEDGHSQLEIDDKINTAYHQFFQGDPNSERIYFGAGQNENGPLAYILNTGDEEDVRSEGMSYGMMIAVQLGHKAEFDAIWNWAQTYMLVSNLNDPSFGYYAWSCKKDGRKNSDTPHQTARNISPCPFISHRLVGATAKACTTTMLMPMKS